MTRILKLWNPTASPLRLQLRHSLSRGREKGAKLSAHLIRFDVPITKDKEVKVKYRIRFRY